MDNSKFTRLNGLKGPVLVTGHTGFKGTWLISLLNELGIETVGLSLEPNGESLFKRGNFNGMIPEVLGDIRNREIVQETVSQFNPGLILHLAAQPLVLKSYEEPVETFDTNVMGTVNILNAGLQSSNLEAIGIVTTDKVYRNYNYGRKFIESDPLEGRDPYSSSKVASEAVVTAWRQLYKLKGEAKLISLRAGNVIGGGDLAENRLLPDVVRAYTSGEVLEVRNSNSTRPWQHVLDPLMGYLLALESLLAGNSTNSYNFGPSESSISVADVITVIQEKWNIKVHELETEVREYESKFLELDSIKAKVELDWHPRYSQRDAILKTIEWWESYLMSGDAKNSCRSQIREFLSISS